MTQNQIPLSKNRESQIERIFGKICLVCNKPMDDKHQFAIEAFASSGPDQFTITYICPKGRFNNGILTKAALYTDEDVLNGMMASGNF